MSYGPVEELSGVSSFGSVNSCEYLLRLQRLRGLKPINRPLLLTIRDIVQHNSQLLFSLKILAAKLGFEVYIYEELNIVHEIITHAGRICNRACR